MTISLLPATVPECHNCKDRPVRWFIWCRHLLPHPEEGKRGLPKDTLHILPQHTNQSTILKISINLKITLTFSPNSEIKFFCHLVDNVYFPHSSHSFSSAACCWIGADRTPASFLIEEKGRGQSPAQQRYTQSRGSRRPQL